MKNTFIVKVYLDTTTVSEPNYSQKTTFLDQFIGSNPAQGNDLTQFYVIRL